MLSLRWADITERLNEDIQLWELMDALVSEEESDDEDTMVEKRHWWNFLQQLSNVPVMQIQTEARKIRQNVKSEAEREFKYGELVRIPPRKAQIFDDRFLEQLKPIRMRTIEPVVVINTSNSQSSCVTFLEMLNHRNRVKSMQDFLYWE